MKIAIAIKTVDRSPEPNYLGQTLRNLERAGVFESEHFHSLTIVDGGSVDLAAYIMSESVSQMDAIVDHAERTLQQNARRAIKVAASTDADWCLVLEDDIDVCDDFLGSVARWLEEHASDEFPMYVFGANYQNVALEEALNETLWRYPIGYFYGAQALAWKREVAAELAEWLGPDPDYDGNRDRHHDLLLRRWAEEKGFEHFGGTVPAFVQHIGKSSTLGNVYFQFGTWRGPNWRYEGRRRRVLWVGDAVAASGFARCTHAVCDYLHEEGWEVDVLGINYPGDPLPSHLYPYRIFPACSIQNKNDPFGECRVPDFVTSRKYDVVVLLNDPWNIPRYVAQLKELEELPPVVGWLAVDAKNQKGGELSSLAHVVTFTDFGLEELRRGGYEGVGSVVPLGVDRSLFAPRDQAEARKVTPMSQIPADAFVVGVVARNQYRKRLDLSIEYFSEWVRTRGIEDAYLCIFAAGVGHNTAFYDLHSLARYHGPEGRYVLCLMDMRGAMPEEWMSYLYASFDVFLSTSQGEGWGLPVLEAMACGVPCIVPDWSGLGSWVGDAALKVPCTDTAINSPLNGYGYTIGGVPDRATTIEALDRLYRSADVHSRYRQLGLECARELSWERTAKGMAEILRRVVDENAVNSGGDGGEGVHPAGEAARHPGSAVAVEA